VADLDIHYDPIAVNSGPVTVAVTGLDNVKVDSKLDTKFAVTQPIETKSALTLSIPDPIKTDGKFAFTIPEPIRTEAKAAIDLQPVVVDQCLRLSLGALPPTLVCLPNRQRLGLTLFGVEVFGLTLDGESRIVVSDLPKTPHVITAPAPPHPAPHHVSQGVEVHQPAQPTPHSAAPGKPFVVRLG
jgi:hypothetical protein